MEQEYITFKQTNKDGEEIELAVIDEFDYDHKHYVAAALIVNETVDEDSLFLYRAILKDDELITEKIPTAKEYQEIAEAYLEME